MKAEELFRNVTANIHELYLALAGLPKDMKVKAGAETGASEKTVDELWARTTWPLGLVITTPRKLRPLLVLDITTPPTKGPGVYGEAWPKNRAWGSIPGTRSR